ncbi:MAG TPA: VOC family protein [Trueperaceae bacterium]
MADRTFDIQEFIPSYPSRDLAAAADFYGRELRLALAREEAGRVVFRVGEGAWLAFHVHEDRTHENEAHEDRVAPLPGLVLSFVTEQVDALYQSLRHHGVETEGRPKASGHDGAYGFVARDPDGYRVRVCRPAPRS